MHYFPILTNSPIFTFFNNLAGYKDAIKRQSFLLSTNMEGNTNQGIQYCNIPIGYCICPMFIVIPSLLCCNLSQKCPKKHLCCMHLMTDVWNSPLAAAPT